MFRGKIYHWLEKDVTVFHGVVQVQVFNYILWLEDSSWKIACKRLKFCSFREIFKFLQVSLLST